MILRPEEILYLCILVLIILYGFSNFKYLDKPYRILVWLIVTTILNEIISKYLAYTIKTNMPAYHIYAHIQYLFLSAIYFSLFSKKSFGRYFAISSFIYTLFFSIINSLYIQSINIVPSNVFLSNSLFITVYTLLIYKQIIQNVIAIPLYKQGKFWLNTATLFYFSTTLLFWAFFNSLQRNNSIPETILYIYNIVTIITYCLYGFSIFCNVKQTKANKSQVDTNG